MYVRTYVCMWCIYIFNTHTHTHAHNLKVSVHVCMFVCMYECIHTHITHDQRPCPPQRVSFVLISKEMPSCYIFLYIYIYIYIYRNTRVCIHIYVCMHICMYACMYVSHTHTHTHKPHDPRPCPAQRVPFFVVCMHISKYV
jgi:hypothetical protein